MTRVLVAFGSSEGQTATIAERVGDVLESEGHEPTLVHLKHPPAGLDVAAYDGVIVGASIHAGSHQGYVTEFVREHLEAFLEETGWEPDATLTVAGDHVQRVRAGKTVRDALDCTEGERRYRHVAGLRVHGLGGGRSVRTRVFVATFLSVRTESAWK